MLYADNNATTAMDPSVLEAMMPFLREAYANPSSPCTLARRPAAAIQRAREILAGALGAESDEISFTGGGSESNGLAILGGLAAQATRRQVVISAVEHACVHETALALAERGYRMDLIPVSRRGDLDEAAAARLIGAETALVSVMLANNESGAILPVARIARLARAAGAVMHTDAVQAVGKVPVRVGDLGVDLLSCCAHKLHGPKGVGALYVRTGLPFSPPWRGGDQEFGRRPGTENVAGIVGFGRAMELVLEGWGDLAPVASLRDALEARVRAEMEGVTVVAADSARLPNTSLLLIEGISSEALIARLDLMDICVSSGSACASGAAEPSRVLCAMALDAPGRGALRISLNRYSGAAEVESLVAALLDSVKTLRGTQTKD
jgi:cysteine desulfurase